MGLLSEFDQDLQSAVSASMPIVEDTVRDDTPKDSGQLQRGIKAENLTGSGPGMYRFDVASTARSGDGADYGSIIDQASGKRIYPKKKQALANTGTGWGPYASARQSTKHVGWWDKATTDQKIGVAFGQAADRFDL